jgi:hypothetical protein
MSEITVAQWEHALVFMAGIVKYYGEVYLPVFERVERELEKARNKETTLSRVDRILAEHRVTP